MKVYHLEQLRKKVRKFLKPYKWLLICIAFLLVVILILVLVLKLYISTNVEKEREVISVASLERIVNISSLSTFEAAYNGIAEIKDDKNAEKVKYYVAYKANIKAGIEFDKIEFSIDNSDNTINARIPDVSLTEINVDIGSLEFMFVKDKYNSSTVTEEAYRACEADVEQESNQNNTIFELARLNAINAVTALLKPIIAQLDEPYTIVVE